jgi:hypothetical protein
VQCRTTCSAQRALTAAAGDPHYQVALVTLSQRGTLRIPYDHGKDRPYRHMAYAQQVATPSILNQLGGIM